MASHDLPFLRSAGITRWLRLDRKPAWPRSTRSDCPVGWRERSPLDCVGGSGHGSAAIGVWGNWQPDRFWPC